MNILSRRNLSINFLIWSLVAVFTSTQLYLRNYQSDPEQANWWQQFQVQLLVWWVWGFITPAIFWLVTRFQIGRKKLVRNAVIHLITSVSIVIFYLGCYSLIWNLMTSNVVSLDSFVSIYVVLFLALFHWHFFIYIAILGFVHAREYYLEVKSEELKNLSLEKDLIETQLRMLKMQLQPHFLFNALNSIVSSIHRKKLDTAIDMTTDLSELLRISLAESDIQLVSLQKELDHLKTYLRIEQHRFKDLEVSFDIEQQLSEHTIPNFILQPLVENSIKHGISQKQRFKRINIGAKMGDGQLVLSVFNEGPPLKDEQAKGIGLANIEERLANVYDGKSSFNIHSVANGVQAEIRIPA